MKILVLEDSSQAVYGGGQKITKIVVEALKDSHLIYLSDYTENSLFVKDTHPFVNEMVGLHSKSYRNKYKHRFFQAFYFIKNLFILRSFIHSHEIDILYATTKLTLLLAYILNKFLGLPYVYHAHMALGGTLFDRCLIFTMKKAKIIIAVSNFVKESIKNLNGKLPIEVCYNPIEYRIGNSKSLPVQRSLKVSFFGTIKDEKGVCVLMEAAKISLSNSLHISFLIFGEGNLRSSLSSLDYSNVEFRGHVEDVEMQLVDSTDILILPSIIPEACPTIILQAMSKGIPVITTDIGGQKELVKDGINGFLIPAHSPKAILDSIQKFQRVPDLYNMISNNNLKDISRFPNSNSYKDLIISLFLRLEIKK